jgi:hypothetical protein
MAAILFAAAPRCGLLNGGVTGARDRTSGPLDRSEQQTEERGRQRHTRQAQHQLSGSCSLAGEPAEPSAPPATRAWMRSASTSTSAARIRGHYETWRGELRSSARTSCGQSPMLVRGPRDRFTPTLEGGAMRHWHMAICAGLVAVAIVLVAAGAGAFAFIAPLGCALMMGMMIWMMVRPGGHGGG